MSIREALEFRIAERRVRDYADEIVAAHHDAMECADCDERLKSGVAAYEWLARAEEMIRQAAYEGIAELTEDDKAAIEALYRSWLAPLPHVERWIESLLARGYRPDHLDAFLDCKEQVVERIERHDWIGRARQARDSNLAEEPW